MSLVVAGHLKGKIESDGHCLVMVGIDGHLVEVAEVVGCWEEEVEEGEVEGDQKEGWNPASQAAGSAPLGAGTQHHNQVLEGPPMTQTVEGESQTSSPEQMPSQSPALWQLGLAQHGSQLPDPLHQM